MKETHEILRELRNDKKYTQEYIAQYLGTTQQSYSYYELGTREIPLHHLIRLSELYEVSADYLLGISTAYAGSTDLSQQYTEGRSLHDLLYDMQKLNKEQRESLSQFMRFLKEQ